MAILFAARPPVDATDGSDGDLFIDTTGLADLRLIAYAAKASGAWPAGRFVGHGQIRIGQDVPDYHGGQLGEFFLRPSDSNKLYGPKVAAATWAGPYTAAP